jgi:hypothetical protein
VSFHLFRIEFEVDYSRFSELLYFSSSCLLDQRAINIFGRVEFHVEISEKSSRIRFSDIHNPTLRFWDVLYAFPDEGTTFCYYC